MNYWNEELSAGLSLLTQAMTLGMGILHASISRCISQFLAFVCPSLSKARSSVLLSFAHCQQD